MTTSLFPWPVSPLNEVSQSPTTFSAVYAALWMKKLSQWPYWQRFGYRAVCLRCHHVMITGICWWTPSSSRLSCILITPIQLPDFPDHGTLQSLTLFLIMVIFSNVSYYVCPYSDPVLAIHVNLTSLCHPHIFTFTDIASPFPTHGYASNLV